MTNESVWKILDTTTGEWWKSSSNRIWLNAAARGTFNKSRLRYDPKINGQSRYVLKEFKLTPVED